MKVRPGQTLIDMAVQHLGSAEAAFDLAVINGKAVTDSITPGTTLTAVAIEDQNMVNYLKLNKAEPATAE